MKNLTVLLIFGLVLTGCREDVDLELPEYESELVIEGYLNAEFPSMNYVVLTRSESYYQESDGIFVEGAEVFITPGASSGGEINWNEDARVQLTPVFRDEDSVEINIYMDVNNEINVEEGMHYRLNVYIDTDTAEAETRVPQSVSFEPDYQKSTQNDSNNVLVNYTFKDPGNGNNFYKQMYQTGTDRPLMWGQQSGAFVFSNEAFQGQEQTIPYQTFFDSKDTIHMFLNTIDKSSFEYFYSRSTAANTGGPFATPVNIESNIRGGIGVFAGMGVSYKKLIIEP